MILLILKYLFILFSVFLSGVTLYSVISRGDYYAMGMALLGMVWLGYLAILLVLGGVVYFINKNVVLLDTFKIVLAIAFTTFILFFVVDKYVKYRSYKKYEQIIQKEKEEKLSVIQAYKNDPHNAKNLLAIGKQAMYDDDFTYDKHTSDYFKEAIDIDDTYVEAYKGLIYLIDKIIDTKFNTTLVFDTGDGDDIEIYYYAKKLYSSQILQKEATKEVNLSKEDKKYFTQALESATKWLDTPYSKNTNIINNFNKEINQATDIFAEEFYDNYIHKSYNELYKLKTNHDFKENPNDVNTLLKKGFIEDLKWQDGRIVEDKGIVYYKKAIELDPTFIKAYMYLAIAYYATHAYDKLDELIQTLFLKEKNGEVKLTRKEHLFFEELQTNKWHKR